MADHRHEPGPTGVPNPGGMIRPDDQGGLSAAIGIEKGQVTLDFGKKVAWVSMTEAEARGLAAVLIKFADKLRAKGGGQ